MNNNEYILENNVIKINRVDIPQPVKVRKYKVDVDGLQQLLRSHKNMYNQQIANLLCIKKTTVDHWFRCDNSFSIPDENIWMELKNILNIQTDIFDKSIMEFEYRLGVYEKSERCHFIDGLAPTVTCSDDIKILI